MNDLQAMRDNAQNLYEHTYENALNLHSKIVAAGQTAVMSLIDMGQNLKIMRDQKLYKDLGYDTFDKYSEEKAGIRARQAYNYIQVVERLPKDFLQSNAQLGITKLSLLAEISTEDAEDLATENNLDELTVKQIKELTEEKKKLTEQLSLFSSQNNELKSQLQDIEDNNLTVDELKKQIDQLQEQLKENQSKQDSALSEDEVEKIKQEAIAQSKAEEEKNIQKTVEKEAEKLATEKMKDIKSKHKKELEQAKQKASEQSNEELEKLKAENESLKQATKISEEREKELQSKLKLSDSNIAMFNIYFKAWQEDFNEMTNAFKQIDIETKSKLAPAVKQIIDSMQDQVKECD